MNAWEEYVAEVGHDEAVEQTLIIWASVKRASKELAQHSLIVDEHDEHELYDMFCEHCIDHYVARRLAGRLPQPITSE